ncbi:MAG TPA: ArsC family reductase [Alphaproteobacteria bacterium]|jgi:Spx/MgsR family transcriptional regulator
MMITVYGIKNCDTMTKAFAWLERRKIAYVFHDYKKSGGDEAILKKAIAQHGWEEVINRKGTTWRGLPNRVKEAMNESKALAAALENPSLIRRPLLVQDGAIYLGFDERGYDAIFSKR